MTAAAEVSDLGYGRTQAMATAVRWLRIAFWVGAIVDLIAAIQMLCPELFAFGMHLNNFAPGADYRYAMGMGAALMLGWTALLIWADRKPVERYGVLPLTVFPVVVGLALNEAVAVGDGFLSVFAVAPIWALQAVLSVLFLGAYGCARRALAIPR
jgi:hypothetical protein